MNFNNIMLNCVNVKNIRQLSNNLPKIKSKDFPMNYKLEIYSYWKHEPNLIYLIIYIIIYSFLISNIGIYFYKTHLNITKENKLCE